MSGDIKGSVPKEKLAANFYLELSRLISKEEYDRAIKIANKIIGLGIKQKKAFHCKVVCLIHLQKFEEALRDQLIKQDEWSKDLYFERAYCEYRLNESDNALRTIAKAPEMTPELSDLKAQVLYRLEQYKECYGLYRDICKNSVDEFEDERKINISACCAFLYPPGDNEPSVKTYEILYNLAYKHVSRKEFAEALVLLQQCETVCNDVLKEEECADEEFDQELAFIRVQQAYCLQKLGRTREAKNIYSTCLKINLDDPGLAAVASNNMVCLNKDQNLFDSKKKMKVAMNEIIKHKFTVQQNKSIQKNNCMLLYYLQQYDNCRKALAKIVKSWPDQVYFTTIVEALILQHEDKNEEAIELLLKIGSQHSDSKLHLYLTATHMLLDMKQQRRALETMHKLEDYAHKPGLVGAMVSLHVAQTDQAGAAKVFEKAVAYYKLHKIQQDMSNMWLQAAEFHMKYGNPQVASQCLEELLLSDPNNTRMTAKLITAYVQCNPKKAEELSKRLPTIDALTKNIPDTDIEHIWSYKALKTKHDGTLASPGNTPKSEEGMKKRKKKKKPLPPGVYLDPERWLPKYERKGYRRKRDRRNVKEVVKGSQGSAVSDSASFDFSGKTAEREEDSPEEKSPNVKGQFKKSFQQKKKKKGGRK